MGLRSDLHLRELGRVHPPAGQAGAGARLQLHCGQIQLALVKQGALD